MWRDCSLSEYDPPISSEWTYSETVERSDNSDESSVPGPVGARSSSLSPIALVDAVADAAGDARPN